MRRTKTHHRKYVHVIQSIVHYSNVIFTELCGGCMCVSGRPVLSQTDTLTCGFVFVMDGTQRTAPYPGYIWNRNSPWNHFYLHLLYWCGGFNAIKVISFRSCEKTKDISSKIQKLVGFVYLALTLLNSPTAVLYLTLLPEHLPFLSALNLEPSTSGPSPLQTVGFAVSVKLPLWKH